MNKKIRGIMGILILLLVLTAVNVSAYDSTGVVKDQITIDYPNYYIESISRLPIIIGKSVKWEVILADEFEKINIIHETPAIYMDIKEADGAKFWFKNITLTTNFTAVYENISLEIKLPLLDVPKVKSEIDFKLPESSNEEMIFVLPKLDKEQTIKLKGVKDTNFDDSPFKKEFDSLLKLLYKNSL